MRENQCLECAGYHLRRARRSYGRRAPRAARSHRLGRVSRCSQTACALSGERERRFEPGGRKSGNDRPNGLSSGHRMPSGSKHGAPWRPPRVKPPTAVRNRGGGGQPAVQRRTRRAAGTPTGRGRGRGGGGGGGGGGVQLMARRRSGRTSYELHRPPSAQDGQQSPPLLPGRPRIPPPRLGGKDSARSMKPSTAMIVSPGRTPRTGAGPTIVPA